MTEPEAVYADGFHPNAETDDPEKWLAAQVAGMVDMLHATAPAVARHENPDHERDWFEDWADSCATVVRVADPATAKALDVAREAAKAATGKREFVQVLADLHDELAAEPTDREAIEPAHADRDAELERKAAERGPTSRRGSSPSRTGTASTRLSWP